jgi:DNA-binding MarR family transcriptional regulator
MEELSNIHVRAYFNLVKTVAWIEEEIKSALKPSGLTHAQLNVLYILNDYYPEPVSANLLKEKIIVSKPDITRLIDRLVSKGLVQRETCPENRRKIDITLTKEGLAVFQRAHEAAGAFVLNNIQNKFSDEEAQELRRMMHLIRE